MHCTGQLRIDLVVSRYIRPVTTLSMLFSIVLCDCPALLLTCFKY